MGFTYLSFSIVTEYLKALIANGHTLDPVSIADWVKFVVQEWSTKKYVDHVVDEELVDLYDTVSLAVPPILGDL